MSRYDNWADDMAFGFPRAGFWLLHIIVGVILFLLGMRFAMRRAPLSIMAFRLLRTLNRR